MSWIREKNTRESLDILGQLSESCYDLGTKGPLTSEIIFLVRSKDYRALVDYEISYPDSGTYASVRELIVARQILAFFQKLEFLDVGYDRELEASKSFVAAEKRCIETNRRFKFGSADTADVAPILFLAQRKISQILGPLPRLGDLTPQFGPGANTNVKSGRACPRAKLSAALACSTNFTPVAAEFLEETPHWVALHATGESTESFTVDIEVTPGKVSFVPKNAKTHRSIVIEPILNSFFQKGFGSYIRDRLSAFGVNLRDQSLNQSLAFQGSIDGHLATMDLSSASDTIASGFVASMLPVDWWDRLNSIRTAEVNLPTALHDLLRPTTVNNTPYRLEKFSSMGNGFTFELESLLFYSLAWAVCVHTGVDTKEVNVYGDDIIVPATAYESLERVLDYCGFSVNRKKSFSSGPFRESCGADFLSGFDIRPFYPKTRISERTLFTMHNWFVRHHEPELAYEVARLCDPRYTIYGPDGYGDGHLIGTHNLRVNRKLKRDGWAGGYFDTYVLKEKRFSNPLPGDAILPVYSVYTRSGSTSPTDPDVVRGSRGYAKISVYTLSGSIFSRK